MKNCITHIVFALSLSLVIGCGDDGTTGPVGDATGSATGTSGDATGAETTGDDGGTVGDCDVEPTLSSITTEYFALSCNFSSCHGSGGAGGLTLDTDTLHESLVDVAAKHPGAVGKVLVIPGDPANSFLIQKLEGPGASEGSIMPVGISEPLDPECRIQAVRTWIENGALNN